MVVANFSGDTKKVQSFYSEKVFSGPWGIYPNHLQHFLKLVNMSKINQKDGFPNFLLKSCRLEGWNEKVLFGDG